MGLKVAVLDNLQPILIVGSLPKHASYWCGQHKPLHQSDQKCRALALTNEIIRYIKLQINLRHADQIFVNDLLQ